jgi:hypothetical protein
MEQAPAGSTPKRSATTRCRYAAPAHDGVRGAVRAGLDQFGKLRGREARRVALRPAVLQPLGAALIEAVHPVAQRLAGSRARAP